MLASANLPTIDLTAQHCEHFFYVGDTAQPTAIGGIEVFGDVALLRSLVVRDDARGSGIGSALVGHIENYAWSQGVRAVYLLTTTAELFFTGLGYARAHRDEAPAAIKTTREFAGICPASSAFMAKLL